MQKSSELFEQSLLPDIYIQSQTTVFKQKLVKQRKKMFIAHIILFLIIFSTTIASACLIKQTNQYSVVLNDINKDIAQLKSQLDQKITNQKIKFDSTDNLVSIVIASDKQNGNRKIATLDIEQSEIKLLTQNKLPTLHTLRLPDSLESMRNNILGICSMQAFLPNIKTIISNTFLELQELHFKDSWEMQIVQLNSFNKTKNITFTNTSLGVFSQNFLPQLESIDFRNNSKIVTIDLKAPHLKQLKIDSLRIKSILIEQSNLTKISPIFNISNLILWNSPITTLDCPENNEIAFVSINNISIKSFNFSSPTVKRINLINISSLQSIKVGISSLKPQNQFNLKILLTGLKGVSNQNNYVNQLQIFENHNLVLFENNTMPRLDTITISSQIVSFCNNHLESMTSLRIFEILSQRIFQGNLTKFNNNHCPNLTEINFSFQKILEFKSNILISVAFLNISNNRFNDKIAIDILNLNVWSQDIMQQVDLSNNNIVNISMVRKMYEEAFPNADIII